MNTLIKTDDKTITSDRTFRLTAERLALRSGIRADLKGFKCLTDAIILFGTETCTEFCEIYARIGAMRGLKPKSVMREISYAISQAFGLAERLSAMIGIDIPEADIHSGLVIAYLGNIFRRPDVSLYA